MSVNPRPFDANPRWDTTVTHVSNHRHSALLRTAEVEICSPNKPNEEWSSYPSPTRWFSFEYALQHFPDQLVDYYRWNPELHENPQWKDAIGSVLKGEHKKRPAPLPSGLPAIAPLTPLHPANDDLPYPVPLHPFLVWDHYRRHISTDGWPDDDPRPYPYSAEYRAQHEEEERIMQRRERREAQGKDWRKDESTDEE